jgi:hypothetical protein
MSNKPYSLGFNGHAKACDCEACGKSRAKRTAELWEANGSYAKPTSADSTVFVRSYFRRQSNHLRKYPNTRRIMQALIRTIQKEKR